MIRERAAATRTFSAGTAAPGGLRTAARGALAAIYSSLGVIYPEPGHGGPVPATGAASDALSAKVLALPEADRAAFLEAIGAGPATGKPDPVAVLWDMVQTRPEAERQQFYSAIGVKPTARPAKTFSAGHRPAAGLSPLVREILNSESMRRHPIGAAVRAAVLRAGR